MLRHFHFHRLLVLPAAATLFLSYPAQSRTRFDPAKVKEGLAIAPVPLNLQGKDPNSVGWGSYLVNAGGDCNGCHSAGPTTQYAKGGNPYMGQTAVVNPATYLGGGRDFGPFPDARGPHIVSRNLTPDYTGMAAGGMSEDLFLLTIRTGLDHDQLHPTCTGAPDGTCIPPPFDGSLLQVMSWPVYRNLTDDDLKAIYAYLSSIPCLEGGPGEPPNRCQAAAQTHAVASPKNLAVAAPELALDGSRSTSADGKPLTYSWSIAPGSPAAAILYGDSAAPTVQFSGARGRYTFLLTVTDSSGRTSTDVATVDLEGN
ncbi:MAG TPA: PKD domain-containing protein [Bryobacteraceae bacterium]|nr:PKD domain-containing protein [Bryobacteraceae bacterium]